MARQKKQLVQPKPSQNYILTRSVTAALASVAVSFNQGRGAGFIVSGPPESGKTTLLMMLQEAARTRGRSLREQVSSEGREPSSTEIFFIQQVFHEQRLATAYVDLNASEGPLSAILEQAVRDLALTPLPDEMDLSVWPVAVDAALLVSNLDMLLILLDDAGYYLEGKSLADARKDLLFLQELGAVLGDHRMVLVLTMHRTPGAVDSLPLEQARQMQRAYRSLPLHVDGDLVPRFGLAPRRGDLMAERGASFRERLNGAVRIFRRYADNQTSEGWASVGLQRATMKLQRLEHLAASAEQMMSMRQWAEAERLYAVLCDLDPTDADAQDGLERARRLPILLRRIDDKLRRHDFLSAYRGMSEARWLDPASVDPGELERMHAEALRELLQRARLALADKDYTRAADYCLEVIQVAREWGFSSAAEAAEIEVASIVRRTLEELTIEAAPVEEQRGALRRFCRVIEQAPMVSRHLPPELVERLSFLEAGEERVYCCRLPSALVAEPAPSKAPTDPVRKLADLLVRWCDSEALGSYLASEGIKGRTLESRVIELCVERDPLEILTDLFDAIKLREIVKEVGVDIQPDTSANELREAVVTALGFSIPRSPVGLPRHIETIVRLRASLKMKRQRDEIIGIGIEGCDDVGETVLSDLIHFYATVVMGSEYRRILRERKMYPGSRRKEVEGLTFGQKVGLLERLNEYIQSDPAARERMLAWFERDWIVEPDAHVRACLQPVRDCRNRLGHPEGILDRALKRDADEALGLLCSFFKDLEEKQVYPAVIVVDEVQIDKFGRRTYVCVDDRGCPERLFTDEELHVGREYFFYPVTNPIRVDPLIVAKQRRP